ncbi:hypothetical protein [Agromyces larvae]|uniref:DUF222 domain-containing protein n=1 Tax=Agromyces larvae TaxID=2929802 RepID=A0ABY4C637_9MICO|nr:hypothetical protein [Agromyces larvae]UOE45887.1 hypothetical protein MTO99_09150 [Agromyces larvae]
MSEDIQQVAEEAAETGRKSFDLKARLQKRPLRHETIRVFTDEVTGEALGGFEDVLDANGFVKSRRGWGAARELAELKLLNKDGANDEAIAAKIAEMEALAAKLDETALDIALQAVPAVIKKDARRAAKQHLGIRGKVTDDRADEFVDELDAQILYRSVVSIHDVESGETNKAVTIEDARDLLAYLPDTESGRLLAAVAKLQFQGAIAEQATAQVDFSQRT